MIEVIDLSQLPQEIFVRNGNCKHLDTHIKQIYGVWLNGEQSTEVVDEKLICNDCNEVLVVLSEERGVENYEYSY